MIPTAWSVLGLLAVLIQTPAGWNETSDKALTLILQGKPAEAVTLYERVLKASPDFGDGHIALAEAHAAVAETLTKAPQAAARRRHLETAATHYRRGIELGAARSLVALKDLVDIYRKDGLNQPAEAEKVARQLVAARPTSVVWHNTLAEILIENRRYADAVAVLHQAVAAVDPDDRVTLGATMVNTLITTPEIAGPQARTLAEDGLAIFDQALKQRPADRDLYMFRSGALKMLAERVVTNPAKQKALLAEADRAFDKFRDLNPNKEVAPPPFVPPAAWETNVMKAASLWDSIRTQKSVPVADALRFLNEASGLLDEAMKLKPDYMEAMVYKGLVLKEIAARETKPQRAKALLAEADRFSARAKALREKK
jgi:tetratricopeptide (TPR) repeat protein